MKVFLIAALSMLALVANAGQYVVFYTLPGGGDHRHQMTVEAKDPESASNQVTKKVPGAKVVEVAEAH